MSLLHLILPFITLPSFIIGWIFFLKFVHSHICFSVRRGDTLSVHVRLILLEISGRFLLHKWHIPEHLISTADPSPPFHRHQTDRFLFGKSTPDHKTLRMSSPHGPHHESP
ncbi:hypothetical protein CEXT_390281 [Caerostris extrusa]|uniref:Secreted protein n=1 Tax=Caerostris extrusa TaxID=172846 RepID=A0AAV4NUZ3_CAEEX|nr:hypothetical protein CEXT_390281 [Caerostris extrusa]